MKTINEIERKIINQVTHQVTTHTYYPVGDPRAKNQVWAQVMVRVRNPVMHQVIEHIRDSK